jgi:hypothetical protein
MEALAQFRPFETTSKLRHAVMQRDEAPDTSQLFLVRLWMEGEGGKDGRSGEAEAGSESRTQVNGKVQHVLSGKAAPFSDWHSLVESLSKMMLHQASAERKIDHHHKEETAKEVGENGNKV